MKAFEEIAEAELTAMEHRPGDGRKMHGDVGWYRLATLNENPDAADQRKPGSLRGVAAGFIEQAGGRIQGRVLHYLMLSRVEDRKWDFGYIHSTSGPGLPKRGASRDWLRAAD